MRRFSPMRFSRPLTKREQEILELFAEAKSNKEIAVRLGISTRTAQLHASNTLHKFGVTSRFELIAKLLRSQTNFRSNSAG